MNPQSPSLPPDPPQHPQHPLDVSSSFLSKKSAFPIFRPRALEIPTAWRGGVPGFSLATEALAGVNVGLIALPLALALGIASIPSSAGAPLPPPAIGLFTAVLGGFLVSLLGGSRVQIGGPTAAFVPIVLLIVSEHGFSGLLLATMMAGVMLIGLGVARLGNLIKFIPWPVTSGFTTGIAVALLIGQLPHCLGLRASAPPPREFFEKIPWLWENIGTLHLPAVALALGCMAIILLWPRWGWRFLPGSIVAMVGATLFLSLTGLTQILSLDTIGSVFGPQAIPSGFPHPLWPDWSWPMIRNLLGPAMAIALLGAIESLLSAVVADGLSGDRHDSNTELIAQGLANLLCPLFAGLPVTGAIARTSANIQSGGKTPLAGIFHALTLLAVILLAAPLAGHIPLATMSAVLVVVALKMGEWHELWRLRKMPPSDALVLLNTFFLTVIFDLVIAVEIGMVLAAILFIKRVAETTEVSRVTTDDMLERPEHMAQGKEIPDGVLVYRIFGPFLFGAAEKMEDALDGLGQWPRVLILRLHLVTAMDATGLNALESIVERLRQKGGTTILSGIHQQPLQLLRRAGFIDVIGRQNFCATFDDSLARARVVLQAENDT